MAAFYQHRRVFLTRRQTNFETPIIMYIIGPQGSGKTSILVELLAHHEDYFDRPFSYINLQFSYHQEIYDRLKSRLGDTIRFTYGFTPGLVVEEDNGNLRTDSRRRRRLSGPKLLVYDDFDSRVFGSAELLQFVKGGAHHSNTSVVIICQSYFHSGREKKYANEMIKQGQCLILTRFFKERYCLRYIASQLSWSVPFLTAAYEIAVDNKTVVAQLSVPHHFVLYFSYSTPEFLRCRANVIKKKQFFDERYRKDENLRARFTWIFLPGGSTFDFANFNATAVSSTSKNNFGAAMTSLSSPDLGAARIEPAVLYYLLDEREMIYLLAKREEDRKVGEVGGASTEEEERRRKDSTSFEKGTIKKKLKNSENGWIDVLDEQIQSMISYPVSIRERALRLGRFLKRKGVQIVDGRMRLPDSEERRKGRKDGEPVYFLVDNPADVLIFFSSPEAAGAVRPRDLFSICKYFLDAKIPRTLFHAQKYPFLLLKSLRQFYVNAKNVRL